MVEAQNQQAAAKCIFRNHTKRLLISASTRCASNFSVSICKMKGAHSVNYIMNGIFKDGSQGLQTHLGQLSRIIWFRMEEQLQGKNIYIFHHYKGMTKRYSQVSPNQPKENQDVRIRNLFFDKWWQKFKQGRCPRESWAEILSRDTPSRWRTWISWMKHTPNIRNHA